MGLFNRRTRFPADMMRRLEIHGRAWLDLDGVDPSIDVQPLVVLRKQAD